MGLKRGTNGKLLRGPDGRLTRDSDCCCGGCADVPCGSVIVPYCTCSQLENGETEIGGDFTSICCTSTGGSIDVTLSAFTAASGAESQLYYDVLLDAIDKLSGKTVTLNSTESAGFRLVGQISQIAGCERVAWVLTVAAHGYNYQIDYLATLDIISSSTASGGIGDDFPCAGRLTSGTIYLPLAYGYHSGGDCCGPSGDVAMDVAAVDYIAEAGITIGQFTRETCGPCSVDDLPESVWFDLSQTGCTGGLPTVEVPTDFSMGTVMREYWAYVGDFFVDLYEAEIQLLRHTEVSEGEDCTQWKCCWRLVIDVDVYVMVGDEPVFDHECQIVADMCGTAETPVGTYTIVEGGTGTLEVTGTP